MSLSLNAAYLIARYGETMTLRREGEGATISLKGKRIGGGLVDGANSATQEQLRVRIAPTEIAASAWSSKIPSAATDSITIGGRERTVLDVRPLMEGEAVAMYELEVAG